MSSFPKQSTEVTTPLTLETAINKVLATMPEEGKLIQAMAKKDISVLGEGEAFALPGLDGQIKAYRTKVQLSVAKGHIYDCQKFKMIACEGYLEVEKWCGGGHYFPPAMTLDGQERDNPYRVYDGNGRLLRIYYLVNAGYLAPNGAPRFVSLMYCFDVDTIRQIDLFAKAKATPQAFRIMARGKGEPKDDGAWIDYDIDGHAVLWINAAHPEAISLYAVWANTLKTLESNGRTKAIRTALKALYGFSRPPIVGYNGIYPVHADTMTVPITMWKWPQGMQIDWGNSVERYQRLIGIDGDKEPTRPQLVSASQDEESSFTEAEDESDVVDVGRAEAEPAPESAPEEKRPDLSPEDLKAKLNFEETAKLFPTEFAEACAALKVPSVYVDQARAGNVMNAVAKILEGGSS